MKAQLVAIVCLWAAWYNGRLLLLGTPIRFCPSHGFGCAGLGEVGRG